MSSSIAIVGINYFPELTGIPVYTTGMAEYLVQKRFDVIVYTAFPYYPDWLKHEGDRGKYFKKEVINNVKLRRSYVYVPNPVTTLKRIIHELSFVLSSAVNYLMGPRADLTIVVSPPLFIGLPVLLLARLKCSRVLFHVQDLQPDAAIELGMLKDGVFAGILRKIEKAIYDLADSISTISSGMLERILKKGVDRKKSFLLRNWGNDDVVFPQGKDTDYRLRYSLNGKFVVLYAGNFGVKQGLDVVVQAAEKLRHRSDIQFLMAGNGAIKTQLVQYVNFKGLSNITFLSPQPFERLSNLLATADVSIVPQRKEAKNIVLPSKLLNIMASARPVIATTEADSELGRVIDNANCGLLVEPENADELAKAVIYLKDHPEEADAFGTNGRGYMVKHLTKKAHT
ncbi:MAG: WcaI family glycosyltransferase [Deltaproteobacteria bacterium]|nr:WcaI family glycosyltransferase [Deltaproteobacteria bacterium]MBW2331212.1 WcaI family glycosyltransferase [Deltaproteobacteria bacterium]